MPVDVKATKNNNLGLRILDKKDPRGQINRQGHVRDPPFEIGEEMAGAVPEGERAEGG